MAGQKFEYDESGSTFFYFLISVLGLILVPCTFYFFPSDVVEDVGADKKRKQLCKCPECLIKKERLKSEQSDWKGSTKTIQRLFIIIGWVIMAALVYKVQQFDYEYANFDPYDILGVSVHASSAEIKKAYRKQSLVYHPDKSTGDERKFMRLNKAYQALTDPTSRRNYELYGNPDGPGAMHFGIALPSWIVEKENSIWVLGLYTLVFMIGLPTVVAIWWYRSSKFTADQVLVDTTQLFYYFFHKTPNMIYKRALMVLSAAFEFEKGHNAAIVERPADNFEVPALFKHLPHLNEKNKERPLCFSYSVKARVLLHSHLSRIPLNPNTLDKDRLYLMHCCPTLIQEMVTCVAQLIMLAHAGRVSRLPTLDTIEATMKLSQTVVQALWDSKNPMLQLPHFTEARLRSCVVRGRTVRSVQQFVMLNKNERNQILKSFTPEEQEDILQVCAAFPHITMNVTQEVVDDDDSGEITAGAIVTVTVHITRRHSGDVFPQLLLRQGSVVADAQEVEKNKLALIESKKLVTEEHQNKLLLGSKKDTKWSKTQRIHKSKTTTVKKTVAKGGKKKDVGGGRPESRADDKDTTKATDGTTDDKEKKEKKVSSVKRSDDCDSDEDDSHSHSDESEAEEADTESHKEEKIVDDDEDAEWEKFQKGLMKREKVLEGKSKLSHSVHCPFFPDDKQEFWWIYVCDRKTHKLITIPYQITDLIEEDEVQLKMTAPLKPGIYSFQVCIRSDSYLGMEDHRDIRLDVKKAREIPTEHPQWQECSTDEEDDDDDDDDDDDEEENGGGARNNDSEFTTDDEMTDGYQDTDDDEDYDD